MIGAGRRASSRVRALRVWPFTSTRMSTPSASISASAASSSSGGDVAPVFDRFADARLGRVLLRDAAVVGEDLDRRAVVQARTSRPSASRSRVRAGRTTGSRRAAAAPGPRRCDRRNPPWCGSGPARRGPSPHARARTASCIIGSSAWQAMDSGAMRRSSAARSCPASGCSSGHWHCRCRRLIQCCTTSRCQGVSSATWRSVSSASDSRRAPSSICAICFSAVAFQARLSPFSAARLAETCDQCPKACAPAPSRS